MAPALRYPDRFLGDLPYQSHFPACSEFRRLPFRPRLRNFRKPYTSGINTKRPSLIAVNASSFVVHVLVGYVSAAFSVFRPMPLNRMRQCRRVVTREAARAFRLRVAGNKPDPATDRETLGVIRQAHCSPLSLGLLQASWHLWFWPKHLVSTLHHNGWDGAPLSVSSFRLAWILKENS